MLLRQSGIEPEVTAPDVDERAVIAQIEAAQGALPAPEHVLVLAQHKARDVAERLALAGFEGIVIGGDSMFEFDGAIVGKPYEPEVAIARWKAMRGRQGTLHSGHCVIRLTPGQPPREASAVSAATVHFAGDITDEEITAYVATGEPLLVAGAFTIDSLGGAFIDRVEGDPSTVVGMSLSTLRQLVGRVDVTWTSLWNTARS